MPAGALSKTLLVAIPAGMWLARGHASLGQALALLAGAALVTWAWIALSSPREPIHWPEPPTQPVVLTRRGDCRIERTPRGRLARDLRCPGSGATVRAHRPTRPTRR